MQPLSAAQQHPIQRPTSTPHTRHIPRAHIISPSLPPQPHAHTVRTATPPQSQPSLPSFHQPRPSSSMRPQRRRMPTLACRRLPDGTREFPARRSCDYISCLAAEGNGRCFFCFLSFVSQPYRASRGGFSTRCGVLFSSSWSIYLPSWMRQADGRETGGKEAGLPMAKETLRV